MQHKRLCLTTALIFFVAGLFFIINSQANITGAVISTDILPSSISSISGIFLMLMAVILLFVAHHKLEEKINISSHINNPGLIKYAKNATKSQQVQRDIDHLTKELGKGNLRAGLGHLGHVEETDILYLRGRHGGRLYFRETNEGYEIVGKSGKGTNEDKVRGRLKKLYHH